MKIIIAHCVFLVSIFCSSLTNAQINAGLVAWYKLDGNGQDASGNALNGTNNGAVAASDRFGTANGAMYFNGSWISVPTNPKLNFSTSFSISFWYKKDGLFTSAVHILGKGRDVENGYHFAGNTPGEGFAINQNPPNDAVFSSPLSSQIWHHAVCVYDKSALRIKLYIDNTLIQDKATIVSFSTTNNFPFVMGRHFTISDGSGGFNYPFKGWLDDVRLYNRALTTKDVLELNSMVAHYKLDGITADSSGHGNHGTNTGGTPTQDHFGNCNKAMSLNGTNAYLSAPNSASLNSATVSLTLCGWARSATATSELYSLFSKVVPNTLNCQYRLYIEQNTKRIYFDKNLSASQTTGISAYLGSNFDITAWNHYAVSWDGTNARFYLNGQLVGSPISYPGSIIPITNAPLEIGRDAHGTGPATTEWINGALDDLRIYNRALSAAEISTVYTAAPDYPAPAADLNCGQMAWYKFDGNLNDASNNGHTLALGAGTVAYGKDRKNNCDRSLYLNGASYLKAATTALLESPNYTNQFSVSAWVKNVQTTTSINGEFLSKSSTSQNGLFSAYFSNMGFGCGLKSSNTAYLTTLQNNKWYHMVVTVKNGTLTYYLDGQLKGSKTQVITSYYSTAQLEIGRHTPGGFTEYSNNYLDDLRLYNRALSAAEVAQLYAVAPSSPNPVPAASISASQTNICAGQSVTLTANSNTSGVTYQWVKDNVNIPNAISNTYSATSTGAYQVRITKATGCDSLSLPVNIAVNTLPTVTLQGPANQSGCGSVALVATATAGVQYLWKRNGANISGSNSSTITATQNGSYTVVVTNSAGCSASSSSINVTINTAPSAIASANTPCAGQSLNLSLSTNGQLFSWIGPAGFSSIAQSPVRNNCQPNMSGVYTVTVTNASGCTVTSSVAVTIGPLPIASATASPTAVCQGETIVLEATGGVAYVWSNGLGSGASKSITPSLSSVYTVTVTNSQGCSTSSMVSAVVYPLPIANAGQDAEVCLGSVLELSATGGDYYSWSGNVGNTAVVYVSPNTSSSYVVTVTDANGCSDTDDVWVTVRPLPTANAGPDQTICRNQSAELGASGGVGYVWSNGSEMAQIVVSPTNGAIYYVTVSNSFHCIAVDTVSVYVNPLPNGACISDKPIYCERENALLTAFGGQYYFWTLPNGSTIGPTTQPVTIPDLHLPADDGVYSVIIEDENSCRDTTSLSLNVLASPIVGIEGDSVICFEENTVFTLITNGDSFIWNNGDNTHPSLHIYPSSSGTDIYAVTVTGANGCTGIASKTLITNPRPNLEIKGDERPICIGSDTTLTAAGSGANTYVWNTGQSTVSILVSPTQTTHYQVVGSNAFGCRDTALATVVVRIPPVSHLKQVNIACLEDQPLSGALPEGGKGEWFSLDGAVVENADSSITQAFDLSPGYNRFVWKVQNPPCLGIVMDTMVLRLVNQQPVAFADDTLAIQAETALLNLVANDSLAHLPGGFIISLKAEDEHGDWSLSPNGMLKFEPNADFTGVGNAIYQICNKLCPEYCSEAAVTVLVRQPDDDIGQTIVITPDGNGENDQLKFDYLSQYKDNSLVVFNRWGQRVFYAKPYDNNWTGTYNGEPLPAGTYYYILNFENKDERVWGDILILR